MFSTSLVDFNLPQDLAPENYVVEQKLDFEIDTNVLPVPKEIIVKTKFRWDFGDSGSAAGLSNSYTYTKAGAYFLEIYAEYESVIGEQLFQSVLVNVLPDARYKLPEGQIAVDGKVPKDPLVDVINFRGQ